MRGAGGRGRSRSPPNIDRYQPPRDDHYRVRDDFRRRPSPPPVQPGIDRYVPGHETPVVPLTNPLPNPLSLDYQVGFNWFSEWWRVENAIKEEKDRQKNGGRRTERLKGEKESREDRAKEREQIQAAYDSYKEKLQAQMARSFVQAHKSDEWFKERYDPKTRVWLRNNLCQVRRGAQQKWSHDLETGLFDEFTLEGIYKTESNGAGGIVEKEEGEATAANEVLGVSDLVPTRGGDIRDEAALQPTLLIKTIAPTVSREKMEGFCKEHLGEGEGGFRCLSLSDPNPMKKYHRIGWVMLHPGPERMEVDDRADGRDEEHDGEDGHARSEAGAGPPLSTAAKALAEINGKTIHDEERGDFTCHVGIHEPPAAPRKKALWDLFSAPERVERDLQLAVRIVRYYDQELGSGVDGVAKVDERVDDLRSKGWLQPPVSAPTAKKVKDKDMDEDSDEGAVDEEEENAYDDEVDDEELLSKKKRLDLLVEYLRRVYNFCLFCVFESDSVHELSRKCPGGHLRRPRSSLTSAAKTAAKASAVGEAFPFRKDASNMNGEDSSALATEEKKFQKTGIKAQQQLQRAFNWVRTYEEKLMQILDPDSVDLKKIGGRNVEEGIEEELAKFVKQEDESRYRCKVPDCTKLFKGNNFWRKHVEKRHGDFFNKIKQDVTLVNSYVLDPSHIAPSRSDANSNGHFPISGHVTTGTPRGFNLSMSMGLPMNVPGAPTSVQMAAYLAQHGINPPWGAPGFDDDRNGPGPRRNGNRFAPRGPPGPYDRASKDSRNMRWAPGAVPGRLTPPRAGARPVNPRFADTAPGPGPGALGRSLKSYEDLDAAASSNGGTGELDY
ncbi:hypothetical protein EJ06DRAFT_470847 [Trichodelitschia bisporula]|uniref:C2H2-type domain-containing protein n=1 Tax=Trichodelitschia bisporula TaxID=703511 RepID=A0A6G1I6V4_9PEZI|nr:hypothetical protein EJ06DRAFT_470847 [Trichodelitschia bisporula]